MADSLILVNGLPASGKTTLARALSADLSAELVSKDDLKEAVYDLYPKLKGPSTGIIAAETMWLVAAALPGLVLVDSWWFRERDLKYALAGAARTKTEVLAEVWCDTAPGDALSRFKGRSRHTVHRDADVVLEGWPAWAQRAVPLGQWPVVRARSDNYREVLETVRRLAGR